MSYVDRNTSLNDSSVEGTLRGRLTGTQFSPYIKFVPGQLSKYLPDTKYLVGVTRCSTKLRSLALGGKNISLTSGTCKSAFLVFRVLGINSVNAGTKFHNGKWYPVHFVNANEDCPTNHGKRGCDKWVSIVPSVPSADLLICLLNCLSSNCCCRMK